MKVNGIPDRWIPYTPIGTVIPGTRFVACKVPLKETLLRKLPATCARFGPEDLLRAVPNLKLLVDLTNTDRYYDGQEFIRNRIQYEKLNCPGHVVPPNSIVKRFFAIVDAFLETQGADSLIVVHCTHGVNRTGYFICRYMIEKLNINPQQAVESFNTARGHCIERPNYLKDLKSGCRGGPESNLSRGFFNRERTQKRFREDFRSSCNVEGTDNDIYQDEKRRSRVSRDQKSYKNDRRGNNSSRSDPLECNWRTDNRNDFSPRDNNFTLSRSRIHSGGDSHVRRNIIQQSRSDGNKNNTTQSNDVPPGRHEAYYDNKLNDLNSHSSRYPHSNSIQNGSQEPSLGRYSNTNSNIDLRPNYSRPSYSNQRSAHINVGSPLPSAPHPSTPTYARAPLLPNAVDHEATYNDPYIPRVPVSVDKQSTGSCQPQLPRPRQGEYRPRGRGQMSHRGYAKGSRGYREEMVSSSTHLSDRR